MKILLIDDSEPDRELVRLCLNELDADIELIERADADDIIVMLSVGKFDCVLLDLRLPNEDGITVLQRVREQLPNQAPPIVMLTGTADTRTVVQAMQNGASDYVLKDGLDPVFLWRSIKCAVDRASLQRRNDAYRRQIHFLALYDPLTLVGNRTLFLSRIEQLFAVDAREPSPFTVIFADVRGFRAINERHGRGAGDAILTEMGRRLSASLRAADSIFRIGSDQFAIILESGVDEDGAGKVADAIAAAMTTPVLYEGQRIEIAADIASVRAPAEAEDADLLLAVADRRLTASKLDNLSLPDDAEAVL